MGLKSSGDGRQKSRETRLATESLDQLASCSECVLNVYMEDGDTGKSLFFLLHSHSPEDEVLTTAPIDQRG